MVNSNTLRIMSGDAIANGRHWSIDDSYEEYTIENGTPGYKRIDLAVAHIETMPKATIEIRILKGEEATGTPEKPSYIEGDLNDGDTVIEVPICSVLIDGINPGEPVSEMMILMSYDEFRKKTADDMKELRDSLSRVVLYDGPETTASTIHLADNVGNYSHVRIDYHGNGYASTDVCDPDGKSVSLTTTSVYDNRIAMRTCMADLNGSICTLSANAGWGAGEANVGWSSRISICRIEGYR